jgi:hypothetical protein
MDAAGITFRHKDHRREGADCYQTMTLEPAEFIRRFLLHVLPGGFHRIRHYGLFARTVRRDNIARARHLLGVPQAVAGDVVEDAAAAEPWRCCPCCGGAMIIVEILARAFQSRAPPTAAAPSARASP